MCDVQTKLPPACAGAHYSYIIIIAGNKHFASILCLMMQTWNNFYRQGFQYIRKHLRENIVRFYKFDVMKEGRRRLFHIATGIANYNNIYIWKLLSRVYTREMSVFEKFSHIQYNNNNDRRESCFNIIRVLAFLKILNQTKWIIWVWAIL